MSTTENNINLSSPWVTFAREIEVLFGKDPDIKYEYNESANVITLYVDNVTKAEAITKLLPSKKTFGNLSVFVRIVPGNSKRETEKTGSVFTKAFDGNPVFSRVIVIEGVYINPITYVVFKREVAQFWNDNMGDPHGVVSTLYQEIAKDVFEVNDVCYCTEVEAQK